MTTGRVGTANGSALRIEGRVAPFPPHPCTRISLRGRQAVRVGTQTSTRALRDSRRSLASPRALPAK